MTIVRLGPQSLQWLAILTMEPVTVNPFRIHGLALASRCSFSQGDRLLDHQEFVIFG